MHSWQVINQAVIHYSLFTIYLALNTSMIFILLSISYWWGIILELYTIALKEHFTKNHSK